MERSECNCNLLHVHWNWKKKTLEEQLIWNESLYLRLIKKKKVIVILIIFIKYLIRLKKYLLHQLYLIIG